MDLSNLELPAEMAELLDVGVALGQNHAFSLIAGRCSAAQASGLQHLRESKLYKRCTPHWDEFCARYLGMSRSEADKIIRLWQQFGAGYFEVSQLTRISPQTYRAIEPAVKDGALHFEGEAIELNPENSRKVAAAVTELRRNITTRESRPQPAVGARLKQLEARCEDIAAEFREISRSEEYESNRHEFAAVLSQAATELRRVGLETGYLY